MGDYSRNGQSGELSKTIDKARKRRSSSRKRKGALIAATLVAGGLLAGGLALANSGDVPPHEERAAYLVKNLQEGKPHSLKYSPYFQVGKMVSKDGWLASSAIQYGHTGSVAVGVLDASPNDGDASIDFAYLILADRSGQRVCLVPDEELGELEDKMDEHYEVSSDAWYRALTEGNESIEGALGRDEYVQMYELCEGRWQAAGDNALESVMNPAEDIPSHEERVAYFISEYSNEWFEMKYSPDFSEAHAWSSLRNHFWVYAAYPKKEGSRASKHIGVVDGADKDEPADGEPDWAWAAVPGGRNGSSCHIEYSKLPEDVQEMLDEFYEAGSEGFYRHVTDGTESYEGNMGDDEFLEFFNTCKELQEN